MANAISVFTFYYKKQEFYLKVFIKKKSQKGE